MDPLSRAVAQGHEFARVNPPRLDFSSRDQSRPEGILEIFRAVALRDALSTLTPLLV
jgi:hypothetical protein